MIGPFMSFGAEAGLRTARFRRVCLAPRGSPVAYERLDRLELERVAFLDRCECRTAPCEEAVPVLRVRFERGHVHSGRQRLELPERVSSGVELPCAHVRVHSLVERACPFRKVWRDAHHGVDKDHRRASESRGQGSVLAKARGVHVHHTTQRGSQLGYGRAAVAALRPRLRDGPASSILAVLLVGDDDKLWEHNLAEVAVSVDELARRCYRISVDASDLDSVSGTDEGVEHSSAEHERVDTAVHREQWPKLGIELRACHHRHKGPLRRREQHPQVPELLLQPQAGVRGEVAGDGHRRGVRLPSAERVVDVHVRQTCELLRKLLAGAPTRLLPRKPSSVWQVNPAVLAIAELSETDVDGSGHMRDAKLGGG
mmetsp:Transcript_23050/g.75146  ORF Transcript_23050/g.75146 Transcript_23050/m.75146 type:complete len:370 (-) Transcript_23050:342-1451(-)